MIDACLFCGGDPREPDHAAHCDGRQGMVEASTDADFDGETYDRARDRERLHAQLSRVFRYMRDREWHTLENIAAGTGDPQASVSARLRDLRKEKFGAYRIARRYLADGLWEYRMEA